MIVNILRWGVSVLYGGLTLFASITAIINKVNPIWSPAIMTFGAILLLIVNYKVFRDKVYLVALSLLLIHISALINGFFMGGINVSHHVVRLIISILIIALFLLSRNKDKLNS